MQGIYPTDWAIMAVTLIGTLMIGIYHAFSGRHHRSIGEYFLGDRSLSFLPASVSLAASFFSAVAVLGFPAEAYTNGIKCWLFAGGASLAVVLSALIFVPVLHPLQLTSANEYLLRRYQSKCVVFLGTLASVMGMLLNTSMCYFAPSTAIEAATGLPAWGSIVVCSLITIIYTTIGGIKAVIWTDVFQTILMFIGMLTITTQSVIQVGGFSELWTTSEQWDRLTLIDLNPDPTQRFTFWSATIGLAFSDLSKFGTQQPAVQRFSAMSTLTKARLSVLGLAPLVATIVSLGALSGIGMFAFYTKIGCDPLRAGIINNPNQLVPHFLMDTMNYPGVQGILLSSLVSASLSTASSGLNSSAANIWRDIIHVIWPKISERGNLLIIKLLVVVVGVLSTITAYLMTMVGGTLTQMNITISAACGAPITAIFLLGMFWPSTNWIGASAGSIAGIVFALWMGFGGYSLGQQRNFLPTTTDNCLNVSGIYLPNETSIMPFTDATTMYTLDSQINKPSGGPLHNFYSVSFLWIACFTTLISLFIGCISSKLTGKLVVQKVHSELLHPWVRRYHQDRQSDSKYTNIYLEDANVA